jgi:hypothetical protein
MVFGLNMFGNKGNATELALAQDTEFKIDLGIEIGKHDFIKVMIKDLYARILYDCLEHTIWTDKKFNYNKIQSIFYSNVDNMQQTDGLIDILTDFIYNKSLQYVELTKQNILIIINDQNRINDINKNIENGIINKNVAVLNFQNNDKIDVLKTYVGLLYNTLLADNAQLNIIKGVIFKCEDLTNAVGYLDRKTIIDQANNVMKGIKNGTGILIDSKSNIEFPTVDTNGTIQAWEQYNGLISQSIGMPLAWVQGKIAGGISGSGDGDVQLMNKGLKKYFISIWKPTIERLFNTTIKFKVETWRGLEGLGKIFDLLDTTDLIEEKRKKEMVSNILDSIGV